MTGIILRQNEKQYFNSNLPQEGEIVFATDTDEIGSLSEGILIWQNWDIDDVTQYAYRGSETEDIGVDGDRFIEISDEIIEYVKGEGSWQELMFGVDQVWVNENVEPNFHNVEDFPYLGKYSYTMEQGYVCSGMYDIVTKEYLEANTGASPIRLDGSSGFVEGYVPEEDNEIVTLGHLLSGDVEFVVPDIEPIGEIGALWNDNGVLKIVSPEEISRCTINPIDGSTWCISEFTYDTANEPIMRQGLKDEFGPNAIPLDFNDMDTYHATYGHLDILLELPATLFHSDGTTQRRFGGCTKNGAYTQNGSRKYFISEEGIYYNSGFASFGTIGANEGIHGGNLIDLGSWYSPSWYHYVKIPAGA